MNAFTLFKKDISIALFSVLILILIGFFVEHPWPKDFLISIFSFGLLAMSLNMLIGFAGMVSFGHAAFFALGGYCIGMHLMREIGPRGVYGDPILPDFMVFLNWNELPMLIAHHSLH